MKCLYVVSSWRMYEVSMKLKSLIVAYPVPFLLQVSANFHLTESWTAVVFTCVVFLQKQCFQHQLSTKLIEILWVGHRGLYQWQGPIESSPLPCHPGSESEDHLLKCILINIAQIYFQNAHSLGGSRKQQSAYLEEVMILVYVYSPVCFL